MAEVPKDPTRNLYLYLTVLNTVGNCNTMVLYYTLLHYNVMGPPSYVRFVVDLNVVMRRMTVIVKPASYCYTV
jgi:hypothetical protein